MRRGAASLGRTTIQLLRFGCPNRPVFHLSVVPDRRQYGRPWENNVIEQVGIFDPVPNAENEKIVTLNLDRIKFWLANDARLTKSVAQLLGLSGFLPIHPLTYVRAKQTRAAEPIPLTAAPKDA